MTRVDARSAEDVVEVEDAAAGGNAYGFGRLRWIGGANSGLESAILRSDGDAADAARAAALRGRGGRPRRDQGRLRQELRDLRGRGSPMPRISAASRICRGWTC